MHYKNCILNAREGDEVEFLILRGYGNLVEEIRERHPVVGIYNLQNGSKYVPVVGLSEDPTRKLQCFYYPSDVLTVCLQGVPFSILPPNARTLR
jgi:hypothetical protein